MHMGAKVATPHDALEVAEVMRGVRRAWNRPVARKAPALDAEIKKMADAVEPQTLKGMRDRALLLLGFAGAFRRSELVAINVEHMTARNQGLDVE
jgi:integrase